ncbi:MAG: hypothetical protein H8D23_34575 [Candidatus Brocadiales bacterium]|nr:hypothetical protein [Candidatus Brocadiales bacterium]
MDFRNKFNSIAKPKLIPNIHIKPNDPKALANQYGAGWSSMIQLYEEGILSFDPENTQIETQEQSYEWDFLARLISRGCSVKLLKEMLKGLDKPYVYELRKIYYDWARGVWKTIPRLNSLVDFIESAADDTWTDSDIDTLYELHLSVETSIEVMNDEIALFGKRSEEEYVSEEWFTHEKLGCPVCDSDLLPPKPNICEHVVFYWVLGPTENPFFEFLSPNVQLAPEDLLDSGRWSKIAQEHDLKIYALEEQDADHPTRIILGIQ